MTITITITDRDMGWDAAKRGLRKMSGSRVDSGLLTPKQAQTGVWAELGTKKTQARPWLSVAADTGMEKIFAAAGEAVGNVADGGQRADPDTGEVTTSPEAELKILGEVVVELARQVIVGGHVGGPPLKASTRERKGHATKLLDSSEMIDSLDVKVKL